MLSRVLGCTRQTGIESATRNLLGLEQFRSETGSFLLVAALSLSWPSKYWKLEVAWPDIRLCPDSFCLPDLRQIQEKTPLENPFSEKDAFL
jgi:hypothetical protein